MLKVYCLLMQHLGFWLYMLVWYCHIVRVHLPFQSVPVYNDKLYSCSAFSLDAKGLAMY